MESKTDFKILLNCLIAMAASDGVLHENEINTILEILNRIFGLKITSKNIHDAYNAYLSSGETSLEDILIGPGLEPDAGIKEIIIKAGYLIMISDGMIVDCETGKLSEIAALLNIDESEFARFISEASALK